MIAILIIFAIFIAFLILVLLYPGRANATQSVSTLSFIPVSQAWIDASPDGIVLFTSNESLHVKAVQGVVSNPAPAAVGLYVVPKNTPCRDPNTNAINGTYLLVGGVSFNGNAAPGVLQTLALAPTANTAVPAGSSICADDLGGGVYTNSRATITIYLGP